MNARKIALPLMIASLLTACAATGRRAAATLESADAAAPSLLWSTTAEIADPESVTIDAATKRIFVSNMAGAGNAKDGDGWIALVTPQGTTKVVEGLNAPKGLRVRDGILWAADIDTVIKVDATRRFSKAYTTAPTSAWTVTSCSFLRPARARSRRSNFKSFAARPVERGAFHPRPEGTLKGGALRRMW